VALLMDIPSETIKKSNCRVNISFFFIVLPGAPAHGKSEKIPYLA
jgi:hypothetical protein